MKRKFDKKWLGLQRHYGDCSRIKTEVLIRKTSLPGSLGKASLLVRLLRSSSYNLFDIATSFQIH
jgi:hypothetical protein